MVSVRPQSLAGWYSIAVHVGSTHSGATAAPVPVQLDLAVTGSPEPGPSYADEAATFGRGRAPEPDPAPQPVTAAGPDEAAPEVAPVVWAVAGAVLALVAVGAGLAFRSRRRS